jgi:maltoporin
VPQTDGCAPDHTEVKFFSRPSLRAFATWAHWSESFRGLVAPVTYGDDVNGFAFGVQLEVVIMKRAAV